jgi:manganese-dependent inorganic pyrophosphatase
LNGLRIHPRPSVSRQTFHLFPKQVRKMPKNENTIYVIGHRNPDTDSIASAMGYAWFLDETMGGVNVIPARAGQLNPQTTWVLDRLGLEPPLLLPDASPRFENIAHRFNTTTPDEPLRDAWSVATRTGGIAPVINGDGMPHGLITGLSLFNWLSDLIGPHTNREDVSLADLFDTPAGQACDTDVPKFRASNRIKDLLPRILREERTEFWVVDDYGSYVGICRQREALHPPRLKVVLVDHNEPDQALGSLDEADLVEILDHHRLGNAPTRIPIKFTVDPVGSTCTLVSERIDETGLSAPPVLAGLLLAGLISDTLGLTSPTATDRDHLAAKRLSRWAFIGGAPLSGETFESYTKAILQAGAGLSSRSPEEIVHADFKLYETAGKRFGISQVEVAGFQQLKRYLEPLHHALNALKEENGLDFAILMVTDVVSGSSRLLLTDEVPALELLPYNHEPNGTLRADGVVSRKKQLLPLILGALEA